MGGRGILEPQDFFSLSNSLYESIAWILFRVNWRARIFFSLNFPLREFFFVLHPPPLSPPSFLMVRPYLSRLCDNPLFLLSHFQILICNELLVSFPFLFWPLKNVCFQTEILGNLFKYIFFVLFFCLLLHRLAVRISLPPVATSTSVNDCYIIIMFLEDGPARQNISRT